MKHFFLLALLLAGLHTATTAQTGIGTTAPASCAALDVSSTTKGFLPPRMTWTQIQAIPFPQPGLTVFDVGINVLRVYTSKGWTIVGPREQSLYDAPGGFGGSTQTGIGVVVPTSIKASRLNPANYYMTGYFTGLTILGGALLINSYPTQAAFFAKFDSTGSAIWTKTLTNTSTSTIYALGMDVDAADNIYICGQYTGTFDFDPGSGVSNLSSLGSASDGFYAHYDANGNYLWAKTVGSSTTSDALLYISVGSTFVNVGGYGSGAFNGNTFGSSAFVVGHYDTVSGNLGSSGWVKQMSGTYFSIDGLKGTGNTVAVVGEFGGTATFPGSPTNITKTTPSIQAGFVCPLNASGFASTVLVVEPGSNGVADVRTIATDASGNYYYAGRYSDGTDFDPGASFSTPPATPLTSGLFVCKVSSSYAFQWVKNIAAASSSGGYSSAVGLVTDASSNVTFAGYVNGPVLLPNGNTLPGFGDQDVFTARYNSSGALQWIHNAGGSGTDNVFSIDESSSGRRIYTANTIGTSPFIQYDGSKVSAQGVYISRYEE